jgi:hypothetical protein
MNVSKYKKICIPNQEIGNEKNTRKYAFPIRRLGTRKILERYQEKPNLFFGTPVVDCVGLNNYAFTIRRLGARIFNTIKQ